MIARSTLALWLAMASTQTWGQSTDQSQEAAADKPKAEAVVVQMTPGVTQRIPISLMLPNRIVTPFKNPTFITNVPGISYETVGSTIYLSVNTQQPVGGFIQGPGEYALSVLLVPEKRPQQVVTLLLDGFKPKTQAPPSASGQPAEHGKRLMNLLAQAVVGKTPPGFSANPLIGDAVFAGPILVEPDTRLEGNQLIVDVYRLENEGAQTTSVNESNFYAPGVLAVAAFPNVELGPGERSRLYIIREVDNER